MAEDSAETQERVRAFVDSLTKPERVLVLLRDELYEGSWDELRGDLEARKGRKPYVLKLHTRIEEDLVRIASRRIDDFSLRAGRVKLRNLSFSREQIIETIYAQYLRESDDFDLAPVTGLPRGGNRDFIDTDKASTSRHSHSF